MTRRLLSLLLPILASLALAVLPACNSGGGGGGGFMPIPGAGSGPGGPGDGSSAPGTQPGPGPGPGPAPAPAGPAFKVSGWLPDWSGTAGRTSLFTYSTGSLDEVNPCWYTLASDGSLRTHGGARDLLFVRECHARGIEVLPMIDDFAINGAGPVVRDATKATRLRAAILDEVLRYELDGIDIDFEGMGQASRDAFSQFMADLAADLHARGKILSAALYSKTSEPGGFSGPQSHDYAALGRSVDRFKIMLYGHSGPVAPTSYIENAVTFAKTVVPASKIYVGVPFFGWNRKPDGSKTSLTQSSAEALARTVGKTPTRHAASGEATFTYVDSTGVTHTVFFQDAEAIAVKCRTTKRLGVAGIAIWRLGGDKQDIWDAIEAELRQPATTP